MGIPIAQFFRILVVDEPSGTVARIVEDELHFPTTSIPADRIEETIRGGADIGAIIVSRAASPALV